MYVEYCPTQLGVRVFREALGLLTNPHSARRNNAELCHVSFWYRNTGSLHGGVSIQELRSAHRELALAKEELRLEREEVNKLRQVGQKGAASEATAPFPLTTADVVELFRLLRTAISFT